MEIKYPGDYFVYIHTINNVVFYVGSSRVFKKRKTGGFNVHHERAFTRNGRSERWKEIAKDRVVDTHIVYYSNNLIEARNKELELIEIFFKMGLNLANKYIGTKVYQFNRFGILMKSFLTYHDASIENNCDAGSICKCITQPSNRQRVSGFYFSNSPDTPSFLLKRMHPVRCSLSWEELEAYETISEAMREMNAKNIGTIRGAISNPNYSAHGHKWKVMPYEYCIKNRLFKGIQSR